MNRVELIDQIFKKRSFLSIGLDTDIRKIPKFLLEYEDPIFEFNKRIIDATKDLCIAYKLNIAFYEYMLDKGWISLRKTINHIPKNIFIISDAKRGDIGNTSDMYSSAFFDKLKFDALTISPYMGKESITPFTKVKDRWTIILALTSNSGSIDFQMSKCQNGEYLFEKVLKSTKCYGSIENIMYVVGATKSKYLKKIRNIVPDHFLLIPGIGSQGGSLSDVVNNAMTDNCGLIVNSSRGIIYSGNNHDWADKAREAAAKIQSKMNSFLNRI